MKQMGEQEQKAIAQLTVMLTDEISAESMAKELQMAHHELAQYYCTDEDLCGGNKEAADRLHWLYNLMCAFRGQDI